MSSTVDAATDSSFYKSKLPSASWVPDRDAALLTLIRSERVLHVGCADAPLTAAKLRDGSVLHQKVLAEADTVLGVDIDVSGLAALRAQVGGEYLHADATDTAALAPALAIRPTIVLAADVIEHVGAPGSFLDALAMFSARCVPPPKLLLSTPNALSVRGPILAAAGLELVHPDHRMIFTPTTLARSLAMAGYRPTSWWSYSISLGRSLPRRIFDTAARTAGRFRPTLADGMIVLAGLDDGGTRS